MDANTSAFRVGPGTTQDLPSPLAGCSTIACAGAAVPLRAANALALSLVAELDGRVVGHVAFSPVTVSDGTQGWYGLGPVSVLPEFQRHGIGKTLIEQGLSRLKDRHARGCCLVGHPDYYKRLGFRNSPGLVHDGVPPEVFLALSFDGQMPRGTVAFHEAFKADGQGVAPADG